MATNQIKPAAMLADLSTVADQIESASDVDKGTSGLIRSLNAMVNRLDTSVDSFAVAGITKTEVLTVSNQISEWAKALTPAGAMQWDADKVTTQINLLTNMQALGMLSDEDSETLDTVSERLASVRSRRRAPAQPQEDIEGRPARVNIALEIDGTKVANQAGNKKTSIQNLRSAAKRFIEAQTGSVAPEDVLKGITEAIRSVVEYETVSASYGGFVITPED